MLQALKNLIVALPANTAEFIGIWVAALLTLSVLSYIIKENAAFRLTEYLFVGVAGGYAAGLVWHHVLAPRLQLLIAEPNTYWYYGLFFALGILLLARGIRPIAVLGNLPLAALFGIGMGLALGGALTGSLVPQIKASIVPISPERHGGGLVGWALAIDSLLLVLGTIAVLSAFHYSAESRGPVSSALQRMLSGLGELGRKYLMIAFGALVAGAMLSFFAILVGRINFLVNNWLKLFANLGLSIESILIADIGSTVCHVCLIDQVEGVYRFIAHAETPSTVGTGQDDVMIGVRHAIRQVERISQRRLLDEANELIRPERQTGEGVDAFLATSDAAPPLNCAIIGLTDDLSISSARKACTAANVQIDQMVVLGKRKTRWDNTSLNHLRTHLMLSLWSGASTWAPLRP